MSRHELDLYTAAVCCFRRVHVECLSAREILSSTFCLCGCTSGGCGQWPSIEIERISRPVYTVSQKKFPPLNSLELCQILTDLKKFTLQESVSNLLQNLYNTTHLTLGMLLHYLGKLQIQVFYIYSADMEENANKLHFKCTDFNSCMHVNVHAEYLRVFENLVLVAEYHIDC